MAAQPDAPSHAETTTNSTARFDRGTAPAAAGPAAQPSSGKATASMVVGIISIVFAILFWPLGIILGLVGLGLAASSRGYRNAKAGMICSLVGLGLSIALVLVGVALL
jgi:hypothetical protein